jgi:mycothiol synthase
MRPARDEDAAAVAALANDESEALIGARVLSADFVLRWWTAPSADRERDYAVVEAPSGEVCGYLGVAADAPFTEVFALGIVALPYHGRGLGAAILAENERRARRFLECADPARRVVVHAGALADEPRSTALLAANGYREVRRFVLMRIDFAGEPPPPLAIAGIEVRLLQEGDAGQLYDAHREAFADHWGAGQETEADFRHLTLEAPWFDPELWFLAWKGPVLAGYLGARESAEEDPSRGYVMLLGVRRAYRRRGIAEALLLRAFHSLFACGKNGCDLHVDADSLTGATRLYERVGMRPHPRFATWEKELRPGRKA